MSALAAPNRFATELRRWRDSRRFSQLEPALRAGTTSGISVPIGTRGVRI